MIFFAEQCTPLKNNSVLLVNQKRLNQSRLVSLEFNENEILKIIRRLNIHKAHIRDDISIRMIKSCGKSLLKPLILLFQNSKLFQNYLVTQIYGKGLISETDLEWGLGGALLLCFFAFTCSFSVTLKNYLLCLLKLN